MVIDPRLGILNDDGSVQTHPVVDVLGRAYERPATTQGIGDHYFVVLPSGGDTAAALDELRALVAPKSAPVKKAKVEDVADPA